MSRRAGHEEAGERGTRKQASGATRSWCSRRSGQRYSGGVGQRASGDEQVAGDEQAGEQGDGRGRQAGYRGDGRGDRRTISGPPTIRLRIQWGDGARGLGARAAAVTEGSRESRISEDSRSRWRRRDSRALTRASRTLMTSLRIAARVSGIWDWMRGSLLNESPTACVSPKEVP